MCIYNIYVYNTRVCIFEEYRYKNNYYFEKIEQNFKTKTKVQNYFLFHFTIHT